MSATNGIMITCDRPGCNRFEFKRDTNGETMELPDGWGVATNPNLVNMPPRQWIFCPECTEKYRSHWYQFLKIHKETMSYD